jgi:hypothetical protein
LKKRPISSNVDCTEDYFTIEVPTSDVSENEDASSNDELKHVRESKPEDTISIDEDCNLLSSDDRVASTSSDDDEIMFVTESESFVFYERFCKHPHRLLPSHLPRRPTSFQAYLKDIFKYPETYIKERDAIHSASGSTSVYKDARIRAFVATCFLPVQVGSFAGRCVDFSFQGDVFPQFTHLEKSNFQCSVCVPYLKWAIDSNQPHSLCRSKKASTEAILSGNAMLSFSGVIQLFEHSKSKCHEEALHFWKKEKEISTGENIKKKQETENIKKDKPISDYFSSKSQHLN